VGDLLLKEVASRIQDCLRESDTAARIGGDEFVILLPAIETPQDATKVGKKVLDTLNRPFKLAGHTLEISGSIGVAVYPEHDKEERLLVKSADIAMYHAKKNGRNNVKMYQSGLQGIDQ
jgi:diguanylate cyclase (GGDEF)-like protein